jgi:hypothetical protein
MSKINDLDAFQFNLFDSIIEFEYTDTLVDNFRHDLMFAMARQNPLRYAGLCILYGKLPDNDQTWGMARYFQEIKDKPTEEFYRDLNRLDAVILAKSSIST